jgi:hypothetical protein
MQKTESPKSLTRASFSGSPEEFHQVEVFRISTLMQALKNIFDSWANLALENAVNCGASGVRPKQRAISAPGINKDVFK